MTFTRKGSRRAALGLGLATAMLAAAACSSGSDNSTGSGGGGTAAAAVPDELYEGTYTAPPATSAPVAKGTNVYWVTCSTAVSVCKIASDTAAEAAKALGMNLTVVDGKFDAGGAWSNGIRTAIAANADIIVLDGISCPAVKQSLLEAKAERIPVIGMRGNDCGDTDEGENLFVEPFKYSDDAPDSVAFWREYGRASGRYIVAASGGKAKLINNAGTEPQQAFVNEGFLEEFNKCSGCEIVDTVGFTSPDLVPNGPWAQAFRTALTKHPDANAIYFPFDLLAGQLGGVQAVKEAGLDAQLFGAQGDSDILTALRNGDYTAASSGFDNSWLGYATMDQVNRVASGEPMVSQGIGFTVIDAKHNLPGEDETSFTAPVDWKTAYTTAWAAAQ